LTTVLLVRHGLTTQTDITLPGRTPGLDLDERGRGQAERLIEHLRQVPIAAIVSSPMERCLQTVAPLAAALGQDVQSEPGLIEAEYGEWTGRKLRDLAREPLWKVVQQHPSAVTFPGGEALRDVQARAVGAVRAWNAQLGPDATWLACSHGDPIRAIVADALGLHLDQFQRVGISPASVTVVRYDALRSTVTRLNDDGTRLGDVLKPTRRRGSGRLPSLRRRPPEA